MIKEIKYFIQRGKRGWADCDVWDIDSYLSSIIPPMVRKIKDGFGCPQEFYDKTCINDECKKWHDILEEIAQGFEAEEQIKSLSRCFKWLKTPEGLYDQELEKEKDKQLAEKYERGMELFSKYFMNLWD